MVDSSLVTLDTAYILIGMSSAVAGIIFGAWRLNDMQKKEIKDHVDFQLNDPNVGLRKCIDDKTEELERKISTSQNQLALAIGEVKGGVNSLNAKHESLLQGFNNHLREAEGITKLGTAKIKEFDETKKDVDSMKISIINLQHWQTDEMKRQTKPTD